MQTILVALLLLLAAAPAAAQIDFSGNWVQRYNEDQPERLAGPELGDYLGLPLTDAARARADTWSASLLTLPEHQCKPHPVAYGYRGPSNMRLQQEIDPFTQRVQKITVHLAWMEQHRDIWMDGRPHPPTAAPHTWQGFSTGRWDGDTLVVTTTHMKAGWLRRNGVPYSDRSRFTERWSRHGSVISHVAILEDPLNLTEPFVRTTDWSLDPTQTIEAYPCLIVDEIASHEMGKVPHYLPGTNTMLRDFATKHGLNPDWAEGGAHTVYPEFRTLSRSRAAAAAAVSAPAAAATPVASEISVLPIQGSVYLFTGAGANVVAQVGPEGVLLVDTGAAPMSEQLLAAVRRVSGGKPIRFLLNTSADAEHTGGNEALGSAGETVAGGDIRFALGGTSGDGATIIAHEAVQARMAQPGSGRAPRAFKAWPTETFFTARKELFFNGEGIQVIHAPKAQGDGDVMVYFRKSDVLVAGDLFSTETYPAIRLGEGGSINGLIAALNRIIDTTIPREKQEGGTYVIPGHGRIVDEAEVVDYRDMVTIIRDRVQDMIRKGMTLDQVRAARPTMEYDERWSGQSGATTAAAFVENVYQSLRPPTAAPARRNN